MKSINKSKILDHYNRRLIEFGYNEKTLGWTKNKHNLRFHILLSHWNLTNKSILDFGCGFADMYGFLKTNGYKKTKYFGVDINPNLIKVATKQYPEVKVKTVDIINETYNKRFDYVFSSGVHNLKLTDNWVFIEKTFDSFNKISKLGFALNFLSNKVQYKLGHTYHSDPAKILNLSYKYSNRITLRNDYMPFEFTIFVDKNCKFDPKKTTYPEFTRFLK